MKLSIIIPFFNNDALRLNALYQTLDCLDSQTYKDFEFIFIEQSNGSKYESMTFSNDLEYTHPNNTPYYILKNIKVKHLILHGQHPFNKAWLMNYAVKESTHDWIVVIDSDMRFDSEYLEIGVKHAKKIGLPFFVGWDNLTKEAGRDEIQARLVPATLRTAGGIFWCRKDFWWEIGGMNECYFGYGGEDNCFYVRANYIMHKKLHPENMFNLNYHLLHTYHHNAEPSWERLHLLNQVMDNPQATIDALKKVTLGKKDRPTCSKTEYIKLSKDPTYVDPNAGILKDKYGV